MKDKRKYSEVQPDLELVASHLALRLNRRRGFHVSAAIVADMSEFVELIRPAMNQVKRSTLVSMANMLAEENCNILVEVFEKATTKYPTVAVALIRAGRREEAVDLIAKDLGEIGIDVL